MTVDQNAKSYQPDSASSIGRGAELPAATAGIVQRLFKSHYPQGKAKTDGASSYWADFYRHFNVDIGPSGEVVRLENYGFGASHNRSLKWRVLTEAFVQAHLAQLRLPGLREAVEAGRQTVARQGLSFSQDSFRQVATATLVAPYIRAAEPANGSRLTFLVIGDGPGTLSALLHEAFPTARIWLIDLGPTLLFQANYLGRAFPSVTHALAGDPGSENASFVYAPSEMREQLPPGDIDFAANVASMEEMGPETVAGYFSFLRSRRTRLFYCCNRLEKRLPGGEVSRILEFPWLAGDVHLIDEDCAWHQWFIGRAGSPHVRVVGIPLPLVHEYDGPHWHRLTRLAPGP